MPAFQQRATVASLGGADINGSVSGNRVPHSAISIQSLFKMLNDTELDLRLRGVIGARFFVHIKTYTKELELKATKGQLVGYSNNSKSYHVYNLATRRIVESRNVIFIETPSRLLPTPSYKTSPQLLRWEVDSHSYITDNNFLRDIRNLTSVLNPLPSAPTDHITADGLSTNPQGDELLDRISNITRRDVLHGGGSELPQERVPSGVVSLDVVMPGGAPLEEVPLE